MKNLRIQSGLFYVLTFLLFGFQLVYSKPIYNEKVCNNNTVFTSPTRDVLNPLSIGNSFEIRDPNFQGNGFISFNEKSSLQLRINDFQGPFHWYKTVLKVKVEVLKIDGNYEAPIYVELSVVNNRYGGFSNFIDLDRVEINDAKYGFLATIVEASTFNLETSSSQATPDIPANVILSGIFECERFFELNVNQSPQILASLDRKSVV